MLAGKVTLIFKVNILKYRTTITKKLKPLHITHHEFYPVDQMLPMQELPVQEWLSHKQLCRAE